MSYAPHICEILVIGGGPAGASIARLLAKRGHAVIVAARTIDDRRGIAESLPPSTRKVLAAIGVLDIVENSSVCRNVGNAVWWGSGDARVEDFQAPGDAPGLQIWRPDFDCLLADEACRAGAGWIAGNVTGVEFDDACARATVATIDGRTQSVTASFVVDASGRTAVLGRTGRRPVPGLRTHAWIGSWTYRGADREDADTRTFVETTDDGWVWSVPVRGGRCVTAMVDPDRTRFAGDGRLESRYLGELAKARHIGGLLDGASLETVWGCDASLYETAELGGPRHLIVGDAASFIDPLSSFGVKKALTSAWMGAAVVHTCLIDPAVGPAARDLFESREREAYVTSVRRSAGYARDALAAHDSAFWRARSAADAALPTPASSSAVDMAVAEAFDALRARPAVQLRPGAAVEFAWQPAFRGDRVALEPALRTAHDVSPIRFVDNVDLTRLVALVAGRRPVGDLFEGYCAREAPVPLPSFLKALSVLVAGRVLEPVDC